MFIRKTSHGYYRGSEQQRHWISARRRTQLGVSAEVELSMSGIDYGLGRTNIDHATGIRYGVISQHSITQAWCDSAEGQYGDPHCPTCNGTAVEYDDTTHSEYADYRSSKYDTHDSCADYACEACAHYLASDEVYPEEALGYSLDDGEYIAQDCLDSDVMVLKSLYYTYAPYCSPCVPGAGDLNNAVPADDTTDRGVLLGVRAYCFNHDWFDDGKAPYRVFRVSDNSEVTQEEA